MSSATKTHAMVREKVLTQGPYTYVANPNVTAANWTAPADVFICEIRAQVAGNIYIDTPRRTHELLIADNFDVFRVRVTRIYTTGTTATGITVFGIHNDETWGVE